jgi:ATP-dependent DNA ligase
MGLGSLEAAGRRQHRAGREPGAAAGIPARRCRLWLRPERVVEVRYDHLEARRFRHMTQFVRWRPNRDPRSCTYAQLKETVSFDLAEVLATTAP